MHRRWPHLPAWLDTFAGADCGDVHRHDMQMSWLFYICMTLKNGRGVPDSAPDFMCVTRIKNASQRTDWHGRKRRIAVPGRATSAACHA
jgi:hypothetical protein